MDPVSFRSPRGEAFALLALSVAVGAGIAGCGGRDLAPLTGTATQQQTAFNRALPAPAATATDAIFAGDGPAGVAEISAKSGKTVKAFGSALGSISTVAMDNAGNVYASAYNNSTTSFYRLAIGGSAPTATYAPVVVHPLILFAAPTGEFVITGYDTDAKGVTGQEVDVWDAGSSGGKPSRVIKHKVVKFPSGGYVLSIVVALAADGTLYVPYVSPSSKKQQYDVIPPGTSKPSRTIVESIVGAPSLFVPNWMTAASDGTLYVGEWGYYTGDPYAGLYVYPKGGTETYVSNGAPSPTGIDLDAQSNVYVVNSNSVATSSGTSADTTHLLSVYSPHASSLLRQVNKGFSNAQWLVVDDNGTAYTENYPDVSQPAEQLSVVPPKAKTGKVLVKALDGENFVLYNGTRVKSLSTNAAAGAGGPHGSIVVRGPRS